MLKTKSIDLVFGIFSILVSVEYAKNLNAKRYIFSIIATLCSIFILEAQDDKVVSFDAHIAVDAYGRYTIREDIKIWASGSGVIKHGLYRVLPTTRRTINNRDLPIQYTLNRVIVNGDPDQYFVKNGAGKIEIYMGSKDIILTEGYHNYTFIYKTEGQVGFYTDYNEIYWDVNGVNWMIDIDTIRATVTLPDDSKVKELTCYKGVEGSVLQDCKRHVDPEISFSATDLEHTVNLTIAVAFEKGTIIEPPEPTWLQKYWVLLIAGALWILQSIYYLVTWKKYGVDPKRPKVIPQSEPPHGLSPAEMGCIYYDKIQDKLITPAIVKLATNGYIDIQEVTHDTYTSSAKSAYQLRKIKDADYLLAEEEYTLMKDLFRNQSEVLLGGTYNSDVAKAFTNFPISLKSSIGPFLEEGRNWKFLALPIAMLIAFITLIISVHTHNTARLQSYVFYLGIIGVITLIIILTFTHRTSPIEGAKKQIKILAIGLFLVVLALLIYNFSVLGMVQFMVILFVMLSVYSVLLYKYLIEQPTEEKVMLQSEIRGFREYLTLEPGRTLRNFKTPPMTQERFEKLLPYALALGVDDSWSKTFESYIQQTDSDDGYSMVWYHGMHFSPDAMRGLSQSLPQVFQESSVPPSTGSDSWSSGTSGGFSGGGAGGGGGGGW